MCASVQAPKVSRPTPQEFEALQEEELRKTLPKLKRPIMASRTDTSISLNLNRGSNGGGGRGVCEVSWHALHDPIWVSKEGHNSGPFTCLGLQAGTKYVFRARAGNTPQPLNVLPSKHPFTKSALLCS